MPRLAPLPREAVTDLGEILRASESRMGFVPNSQLIMARRREILRAFAQLGAAALFVGLGGAVGGKMFSWAGPRAMTRGV